MKLDQKTGFYLELSIDLVPSVTDRHTWSRQLLIFYFTTRNRLLSKPHCRGPKSLNLPYHIQLWRGQFFWNTSKAVRENNQAFLARNQGSNYLQIKLGNIAFNESIVVEYTYLVSLKVKRLLQSFFQCFSLKGSSDPSHFIFEINVGNRRIRHGTTLNLNDIIFHWFWVDLEIQFQSRSMSDPPLFRHWFQK